ncbi:potassium-transporting ATPase subunit KdpB [Demequina lutea]|uniref:Potassium-transporting ATPase ATP-binding subunit n=1 Tax=Demequina lutea TaxID=431489 RepID=A0A7Y9ZC56_9MICO|nr:potassium-transporting ATPase subunit KdpB [Demequina lutea]NYI42712.1 K+-transporting ATPase ATPase B chain [Demequina lutea]
MTRTDTATGLVLDAIPTAMKSLNPARLWRNPVMMVVWAGAAVTTLAAAMRPGWFAIGVAGWLWATVVFGALSEAVAEGRGKARAASMRRNRIDLVARRIVGQGEETISAADLRQGDLVRVAAGETIPADGEIVEGAATVDESAITGESAPVIRESGGDRSSVTGGTRVLSDSFVMRITAKPGESYVDRMIALVEGATRQKTPNEVALSILLSGLTLVFLVVVLTLGPLAQGSVGDVPSVVTLVALLVCLIPTTISALLPAIGISGMERLMKRNVLATSGRAVEAAGDVSVLLLDKTGTITLGDRHATRFVPAPGVAAERLAAAAYSSSLADETPEGRSIVTLASRKLKENVPEAGLHETFVPFTATTRMSGIDSNNGVEVVALRKGAATAVTSWVEAAGGAVAVTVDVDVADASAQGATALLVAERVGDRIPEALGVIVLEDIVKEGLPERFALLRKVGIETVMVTGDNPLTAAAIAAKAGITDVMAEATPEDKLARIRAEQARGRLVAMTGDGTNDAPALAQADVGLAMNTGTSAAKEAGNMVDLDSDPTKLIDVVDIGKQLLVTRGALTTFSVANDVAKYFAILPALFATSLPSLGALNVMRLATPASAILSAVIFNALVIVALIPLALKGAKFRPESADRLLRRNLLTYGLGGLAVPFVGIALIDLAVRHIPGLGG